MAEVRINSVTKLFGNNVKAVNNFSAIIEDGQFVSILGPSGCGKTTMLRMIAGFEKANEGEIFIGSELVSSLEKNVFLPPEKRNIGMVFQSYAVWPHMTVFENVAYPLKIQKLPSDIIKEKTQKALELVHLGEYGTRFPNQLSGGQQQRVALARALVGEPKLLLLDEPLSNLDAKLRESMRFEIKELQKKLNITVIYVTHDQAEAMTMSDKIIVMNKGVIQQAENPVEVYENPSNQIVADFIGLVNFLDAEVDGDKVFIPAINHYVESKTKLEGKVLAAIRPEHIVISDTVTPLEGIVAHKFYLGDATDCRIDIGQAQLRVIDRAGSYISLNIGDKIYLKLDKVMVFPAQ